MDKKYTKIGISVLLSTLACVGILYAATGEFIETFLHYADEGDIVTSKWINLVNQKALEASGDSSQIVTALTTLNTTLNTKLADIDTSIKNIQCSGGDSTPLITAGTAGGNSYTYIGSTVNTYSANQKTADYFCNSLGWAKATILEKKTNAFENRTVTFHYSLDGIDLNDVILFPVRTSNAPATLGNPAPESRCIKSGKAFTNISGHSLGQGFIAKYSYITHPSAKITNCYKIDCDTSLYQEYNRSNQVTLVPNLPICNDDTALNLDEHSAMQYAIYYAADTYGTIGIYNSVYTINKLYCEK